MHHTLQNIRTCTVVDLQLFGQRRLAVLRVRLLALLALLVGTDREAPAPLLTAERRNDA